MIKAEVIDALVAAGATAEMIASAIKADQSKSSGARRQAAYRARKSASLVTSRYVTLRNVTSLSPPPKEIPPTPPKEITPTPIQKHNPNGLYKKPKPLPQEILEGCLSAETAAEVIEHRRALKKPLTGGGAKALAKAFAASGDPEKAAAEMMLRGWQGFKSEWTQNARAGPYEKPRVQNPHLKSYLEDHGMDPNGNSYDFLQTEFTDSSSPHSAPAIGFVDGRRSEFQERSSVVPFANTKRG